MQKNNFHITLPETAESIRTIPMIESVKRALLELKQQEFINGYTRPTIDGYSNFIFVTKYNTLYERSKMDGRIRKIIQMYNDEETQAAEKENRPPKLLKPFGCHLFRHTLASRLYENNVDPKIIQSILGHKNISTTLDIYTDLNEESRKDALKKLNR